MGDPRIVTRLGKNKGRISWCEWPAATRIVCEAQYIVDGDAGLMGFTLLYAVDADETALQQLSAEAGGYSRGYQQDRGSIIDLNLPGKPGSILLTRQVLANDHIGSHIGSEKAGLPVEAVDTLTLKHTIVEQLRSDAVSYVSDGVGNVRLMATMARNQEGYLKGSQTYFYRKVASRSWDRLSDVDADNAGFQPLAVDTAKNLVYGSDSADGYTALYSMSLDGLRTRTKLLSHDGVDIDGLRTIGRQNRVVGASYATERRQTEYFDPALKALSAALQKALPGQPVVDIVDASEDERKLLIVASGDTRPSDYFVFDKQTKQLAEVLPSRPDLVGTKLAPMRAISFKAADGTMIPGYLTLPVGSSGKGLPAIVMPHGGPATRDEWGFDWLVQFYAARGFAVLQPNYRGSSGYGSHWFQKNGFQSWQSAIGDINDAGRWLVSEGIAPRDKLAIVGWSYGGYAALQSSVLDPGLFHAIVAIAPVTDLDALKTEAQPFDNAAMVAHFIGDGPHIRAGSPAQNASRITAPVLLFHGDEDQNVGVGESRLMKRKLDDAGKSVTYVEFPGLDHQLAEAAARTRMLSESDAFLRKALGLPAN